MIQIDLGQLVGRQVLVQFRSKYRIACSVGEDIDDFRDPSTSAPLEVDSWPFTVELVDDCPVLTYLDVRGSKKMVIRYLPAELVAFVTVVENEPPPEELLPEA